MLDLGLSQKPKPPQSAYIRDTDAARFEEDVLTVSLKTPVIVDFWAPWCGPCKQMMPSLEKAVTEAGGQVHLVKVNVDKSPELAEVFRVQSVPAVFGFFQGQPVDGFMGARSEAELRTFVAKLSNLAVQAAPVLPEALSAENIAKMMTAAEGFFRDGKYDEAMAAYSEVLDAKPDNAEAYAGLGWCLLAGKDLEGLAEFLSQMTPELKKNPRLAGLQQVLSHAKSAEALEEAPALEVKIAANPKNLQARYDLSLRKIAAADLGGAIDALVELTRRDREWQEQKARKLLLELFDAMGPAHPLTGPGRRRLSSVLFS